MNTTDDLRQPMRDETPLSQSEVMQGLREGTIPPGPVARLRAFAEGFVLQRVWFEVVDLEAA